MIIVLFSYSNFKDINTAPNRDVKLDTNLNGAVPDVSPISLFETTPQDAKWYVRAYLPKIENQIKQHQALLMHLQQEVAQLEIDRSNRSGGFMVCRKPFCLQCYSILGV